MKNNSLKILLVLMVAFFPSIVMGASVSVSLSCPSSASAGSDISCDVKATPSSGSNLKGIQSNYNIENGTFKSFTVSDGWTTYASNSKGYSLAKNTETTTTAKVGTLKLTMPSSGTLKVTLTNVEGTDSSYNTLSGNSPSASIRVKSTINTLDSLSISGATISFDKNTTTYNVTVNASSTTISATKTDTYSTMSGTGTKTLNYGKNTFTVTVTSESNSKKVYTINVTRPDNRSTNNNLSSIKLSTGSISFNKGTTTYNVEVDSKIEKIKVEGTLEDSKSSFVSGYGSREVKLNYGKNAIVLKVKAENGSEKSYTINVNRKDNRSSNNNLKSLTLSEGKLTFNKSQTDYQVTVDNEIEKLTLEAIAEDSKSTVKYNKEVSLKEGTNKVEIKVTAENGSSKIYKINITRTEKGQVLDSNNNLKEIIVTGYSIEFNKEILSYNLKIVDEEQLEIKATPESEKAIVSVIGNESLRNNSIITIKVIAEDSSEKEYKININKDEANEVNDISKKEKQKENSLLIPLLVFGFGLLIFIIALAKKKSKNK